MVHLIYKLFLYVWMCLPNFGDIIFLYILGVLILGLLIILYLPSKNHRKWNYPLIIYLVFAFLSLKFSVLLAQDSPEYLILIGKFTHSGLDSIPPRCIITATFIYPFCVILLAYRMKIQTKRHLAYFLSLEILLVVVFMAADLIGRIQTSSKTQ